jgi:hypothetical protein
MSTAPRIAATRKEELFMMVTPFLFTEGVH